MYICNIKLRFEGPTYDVENRDDVLADFSLEFCHALNEVLHDEGLEFRGCSIGFIEKEVE